MTADDHSHDHYLPPDSWEAAKAEAQRIYDERVAEEGLGGGAELQPLGLTPRRVTFPDTYGKTSGPIIRFQLFVNHTAECPLRVGFAESLTKWGNGGYQPRASWPFFVDPATVVSWVSDKRAAFLHGPANSLGWGWEQAGYARFTRAEWLTPDGLRQMDLLAQEIVRRGIPVDALRWLTNAQVQAIVDRKDTTTRGLCDHRQISPGTRSDAGNGYPRDVLLTWIRSYHPGVKDQTPPGTPGTVRIGDRGSLVVMVQEYLAALNYDVGSADGVAGPMFDAALRAFQTNNGLDVDGVAGPNTLTQLRSKEAIVARLHPDDIKAISADVWRNTGVTRAADPNAHDGKVSALQELADAKTLALRNDARLATVEAAVGALSQAQGLDPAKVEEILSGAVDKALADLRIVKGDGPTVSTTGYVSGVSHQTGVRDVEDVDKMTQEA